MFKKSNIRKIIIISFLIITGSIFYNVSPLKAYIHSITTPHNSLKALSEHNLYLTQNKSVSKVSDVKQVFNNSSTSIEDNNLTDENLPVQTPEPTPEATEIPTILEGTVVTSSTISATASSVTIQWDAVPDADGYELSYSHGDTYCSIDVTDTTYTFKNMGPATIISYQLSYYKEFLGVRVYSSPSKIFTTCTSTVKVNGLKIESRKSASSHEASILLSWNKMNDASYYVYYKKASETKYKCSKSLNTNKVWLSNLDVSTDYNIYIQAYCLTKDNSGENSDVIKTTTRPSLVSGLTITKERTNFINLKWNANKSGNAYYIYRSVNDGDFSFYTKTTSTSYSDTNLDAGTVYSYRICSYLSRAKLTGNLSKSLRGVTNPTVTTNLKITKNNVSSLSLSWDYNKSATGYMIYRRKRSGSFVYLTSTKSTSYQDKNLDTATNYRYKVLTYADTKQHTSAIGEYGDSDYTDGYSNIAMSSTLPAKVSLNIKPGYNRVRLSWNTVPRANGYYIYKKENDEYTLYEEITDPSLTSKVYTDTPANNTYTYKVTAYKKAFDKIFISPATLKNVTPEKTKGTTTKPSFYSTKKKLVNSVAWKKTEIVNKYAVYDKCYTIPGIRSTNVAGFESTRMCPQGLTFAGNYTLISAYDSYKEENSVIYVMGKKSRKLLTVIVLPDKTHAGGICFDGTDVWITNGKNLCTIPYSIISTAATNKDLYKRVEYSGIYKTPYTVSFLNYYKKQLWTGNFMYTSNGTLRSYEINKSGDKVNLVQKSCVTIPPAVQGVAFAGNGKLILSRAYGYTNELNIYSPKKTGTASMKLGRRLKKVTMPALNEEIAINGKFLYVNFESALPNSQALNHMDRVLAIKLNAILKK